MKKLAIHLTEGPFGPQYLRAPAEGIRQDVEAPRNKLGEQTNTVRLAQSEYGLSDGVQSGGTGAPFLAKIRKGSSVVREESHSLMFQ